MKHTIVTVFLIFQLFNVESQTVFNFNTYNTNNSVVEEIFDTNVLTADSTYCIEVVGTYSIWSPGFYSAQCGTIETAPIFPSTGGGFSTGPVSTDMEYFFSYPTSSICNSNTPPNQTNRIEISLDNGANWFHPATTDPYNASHTYNYTIVGQGFPMAVRHISAQNADDYGQLQFTTTPCGISTLPIELIDFNVTCENGIAELNWSTYTEMDNNYFSIERSTDGQHFEPIAQVSGAGTSSNVQSYSWRESKISFEAAIFRLSQTDFDGTKEYLGTKALVCDNDLDITVYPNPIDGYFVISSKFEGNYKLVDLMGKTVLNQIINDGNTMVQTDGIASGHYMLYVELGNGKMEILKLMKN